MEPVTMAIGMAISAVGLFGSSKAKKKERKIQQRISKEQLRMSEIESQASQKQEALRKEGMEMEALQSRRTILRNMQIDRANALSTGTGQGVNSGSSAIQGAYGQITGAGNEQTTTLAANLRMGRTGFDINQNLFEETTRSNRLLSTYGAQLGKAQGKTEMWQGIQAIGGSVYNNAAPISRSYETLFGRKTGS